jgi:hypothetical protein
MIKIEGSGTADPDPLVRGMDPRIRIHTNMSWIRNTGKKRQRSKVLSSGTGGPQAEYLKIAVPIFHS